MASLIKLSFFARERKGKEGISVRGEILGLWERNQESVWGERI